MVIAFLLLVVMVMAIVTLIVIPVLFMWPLIKR